MRALPTKSRIFVQRKTAGYRTAVFPRRILMRRAQIFHFLSDITAPVIFRMLTCFHSSAHSMYTHTSHLRASLQTGNHAKNSSTQ